MLKLILSYKLLLLLICNWATSSSSSSSVTDQASRVLPDEWVIMQKTSSNLGATRPVDNTSPDHLNFSWGERANSKKLHRCSFVLKGLPIRGPHGGDVQIVEKDTTEELNESEKMILQYLKSIGAEVKRHTNRFIAAVAPVHTWEKAFNTEFYHIHSDKGGHNLLRAKEYSLPKYVADHVHAVMNTVQIPTKIIRRGAVKGVE